tara:strand:+ start:424 stop:657 length:234 start_codon:yes stop_codon:yes gene_type:complete
MGFFKGVKTGFTRFGHHIANIVNFILLLIVYVIGVGLTSIVAKVVKKHFLDLGKEKKSTWVKNKLSTRDYDEYLRSF